MDQENSIINSAKATLYGALSKAQGEFPLIPRDKTVNVSMKSGGRYSFSYAPLETILAAIRKPLANNDLAVYQNIVDGCIVTIIAHSSGEELILAPVKIQQVDQGPQAMGSALTYARRYSLTTALNIAADDDDDANSAEGHVTIMQPKNLKQKESDEINTAKLIELFVEIAYPPKFVQAYELYLYNKYNINTIHQMNITQLNDQIKIIKSIKNNHDQYDKFGELLSTFLPKDVP